MLRIKNIGDSWELEFMGELKIWVGLWEYLGLIEEIEEELICTRKRVQEFLLPLDEYIDEGDNLAMTWYFKSDM